jgi:uncharacterized protein YegP (UPF0339 family)
MKKINKQITHTFQLALAKNQREYFWRVLHRNGNEIGRSSETYTRKPDTLRGLARLIAAIKAGTIAIDASQVPARLNNPAPRPSARKNEQRTRPVKTPKTSRPRTSNRRSTTRPAASGQARSNARPAGRVAASRR